MASPTPKDLWACEGPADKLKVGETHEKGLLMAIQEWSEDIAVVELADDPQYTEELGVFWSPTPNRPATWC